MGSTGDWGGMLGEGRGKEGGKGSRGAVVVVAVAEHVLTIIWSQQWEYAYLFSMEG